MRLMLGMKRQGMNSGEMSMSLNFYGQLCAGLTEISERKSKGNHLVELGRTDGAADPSDFAVSTEEFCAFCRHSRIFHYKSH